MAARQAMLKGIRRNRGIMFGFSRCTHSMPQPSPLGGAIDLGVPSTPHVLPEFDWNRGDDRINDGNSENSIGFSFSSFAFGGSMELMAVPKRKVTPHKKGIRNGPKALKPIPVIIRCKSCGRVKLPHFFCCSGNRGHNGEQNGSTS